MRLVKNLSVLVLASALPLAACGNDPGVDPPVECDVTQYQTYTYVVDSARVPTTPAEATQIALDLDGSEPLRNDNTLGMVIATLADQAGLDVSVAVADAINGGDVILLASLETDNIANSACARMGVYLGANPSIDPCQDVNDTVCGRHLEGNASFELAAASPTDTKIDGQIIGGMYEIGNKQPGNFTIEIDIAELGQPLSLDLVGARIETRVAEGELVEGIIGGAITEEDLNTSILPAIHGVITDVIGADCTGTAEPCCADDTSAGAQVLDIFDEDNNCAVTLEELTTNQLIDALLQPDVDLLDSTNGNAYAPNADGIADSLSIGLGFTAISGEFTVP